MDYFLNEDDIFDDEWVQKVFISSKPCRLTITLCSVCMADIQFLAGYNSKKIEVVSLHIRYFITLGMYFDGFAINNKYIPHISLTIASAMQITETGML